MATSNYDSEYTGSKTSNKCKEVTHEKHGQGQQSNRIAEMINCSGALFIELPEHGDGSVKVFDHDGLRIGEITLAQAFEL